MNIEKALYVIGCSAFVFFITKAIYESQFNNDEWEFEYNENWMGDLTGLREEKK